MFCVKPDGEAVGKGSKEPGGNQWGGAQGEEQEMCEANQELNFSKAGW